MSSGMKRLTSLSRFCLIILSSSLLIVIYFIYTLFSQQQTLNSYKQEASTYSNQIEEANEKNDELKNVKNNINSTEYIENMAREKLGMYLPNERVYIDITN